jgi:hypothetical protein
MAMANSTDSWEAVRALLTPGLCGFRQYAGPRVVDATLWTDYAEDNIKLRVTHLLFTRNEIDDGSYKANFRLRVAEAMLANAPKDGRRVLVERRSFLARAARVRKAKPRKRR